MIAKIAEIWSIKLSNYLEQPELKDVYARGLRILLLFLGISSIAIIISIFLGTFLTTLCFMLSFCAFRGFSGGVHLHEIPRCTIISNVIIVGSSYIASHWRYDLTVFYMLFAFACLLTLTAMAFWIPAGTDKDPIAEPERRKRMWGNTVYVIFIWLCAVGSCYVMEQWTLGVAFILGNLTAIFTTTPAGFQLFHWLDVFFDCLPFKKKAADTNS